jgi:hypothetical protein
LAFYDTDKSKLEWVLTPEHDIELVDLSSDGTTLAWTENVDGYSSIFTKDLRNGKVEEEVITTNLSLNGVIEDLKLSADGKRMGIMMTTPITPSDIYVADIDKDKNRNNIQKISHSVLGISTISSNFTGKSGFIARPIFIPADRASNTKPPINFSSSEILPSPGKHAISNPTSSINMKAG